LEASIIAVTDEEVPWDGLSVHRGNPRPYKTYPLATGVPGLNVKLTLSRIDDFYSPRHRHNFEQIRYAVEGSYSSGKQTMQQGQVGYFPEGCYYGPQDQHGAALLLVLQFPGPSDAYYLTDEDRDAAYERLKARGTFSGGIYTVANPDGQTRNQDSFEAIWEEHCQQKLEYPKPRYSEPIIMEPSTFGWRAHPTQAGLEIKHLGTFGEDQTGVSFLRFSRGTDVESERVGAPELRYVVSGSLSYAGRDFPRGSYFSLPADTPTQRETSAEGCEMLVISLPMILRRQREGAKTATSVVRA
jgi:ChrR-like protein with cupin domain